MNENEKYFIIGVEDGWIKVNKTNWNDYQYLRTKEKMWENINLQEVIIPL